MRFPYLGGDKSAARSKLYSFVHDSLCYREGGLATGEDGEYTKFVTAMESPCHVTRMRCQGHLIVDAHINPQQAVAIKQPTSGFRKLPDQVIQTLIHRNTENFQGWRKAAMLL